MYFKFAVSPQISLEELKPGIQTVIRAINIIIIFHFVRIK